MKKALVFVGAFVLLLAPLVGFAANGFLGPIVPDEFFKKGPYLRGCDIVVLFDSVLKFAVGFSVVVATLMFTYAGFLYVTASSNANNIKEATKIFSTVAFGLFWILAAWLIINIIMSVLTDQTKYPWTSIECIDYPEAKAPGGGRVTTGPAGETPSAGVPLDHQAALDELNAGGVEVTSSSGVVKADCVGACTSLQGLKDVVVDNTVNLKNGCNCDVVVTGGTETGAGHAPGPTGHEGGNKVDLRATPSLDKYILEAGRFASTGTVDKNPAYQDVCGNTYVREGDHWDVTVKSACGF